MGEANNPSVHMLGPNDITVLGEENTRSRKRSKSRTDKADENTPKRKDDKDTKRTENRRQQQTKKRQKGQQASTTSTGEKAKSRGQKKLHLRRVMLGSRPILVHGRCMTRWFFKKRIKINVSI